MSLPVAVVGSHGCRLLVVDCLCRLLLSFPIAGAQLWGRGELAERGEGEKMWICWGEGGRGLEISFVFWWGTRGMEEMEDFLDLIQLSKTEKMASFLR
jgi:hypothetical protein